MFYTYLCNITHILEEKREATQGAIDLVLYYSHIHVYQPPSPHPWYMGDRDDPIEAAKQRQELKQTLPGGPIQAYQEMIRPMP